MKLNILIIILIVIIGGFFATTLDFSGQRHSSLPETTSTTATQGTTDILPDFSMTTLDGTSYQSKDFTGKIILINFWASWCTPCLLEFPLLLSLAQEYQNDLILLAISSDLDQAAIQRFITKLDDNNTAIIKQDNVFIIHDQDSRITFDIFRTSKLPETIIVNRRQEMIHKLIGANWTIPDIQVILKDHL